jgi:hypothetical protein
MESIAERIGALDWRGIRSRLDAEGWARTRPVLSAGECDELIALYADDARFRKRIDMESHRYGRGSYAYFASPLPRLVRELRTALYRRLAPVAVRWMRELGRDAEFPPSLRGFLARCADAGQLRPTPLLLHYTRGGFNCLHQDRYGDVAFPLQVVVGLSRRDVDYEGGEFLLVEQRPRQQSRGHALPLERGELLVFPNAFRPIPGRTRPVRCAVRHGVATLTRGERFALGLIFHDAR